MYDDDSRGLESPDRPQASTDDRARPDGGDPTTEESGTESAHPNDVDPDAASYRLEVIDHQAKRLLEDLAADRTGRPHEAVRHLREIRAEVEWARRGLCEWPEASTAESTGDSGERTGDSADTPNEDEDSTDDEDRSIDARDVTDDGVPMVVRRGPHVTTVLGPDPAAYERSLEAEDSESDTSDSDDGDPNVEDVDGDDPDTDDGLDDERSDSGTAAVDDEGDRDDE